MAGLLLLFDAVLIRSFGFLVYAQRGSFRV